MYRGLMTGLAGLMIGLAFGRTASGDGAVGIEFFVDDRGVPHFSNVPHDPRYRPFMEHQVIAPRFDELAQPLEVILLGPSAATKGKEIEFSVTIPDSPSVSGAVELAFDPAALQFDWSSVEADLMSPGRLRLAVEPGIAAAFAADVRFLVHKDAPDRTVLRNRVIDLESEERRALRGVEGASLTVELTTPPP